MLKSPRYAELVNARKAFDPAPLPLTNPSAIDGGAMDSDHVGPWTVWAHDLNADLMVIGQDWGDVAYFRKNRGVDEPANPTNRALRELMGGIGRPLPEPPTSPKADDVVHGECRVWLTNALPWLKTGGLSAPVAGAWFKGAAVDFLKEQIAIVQPRVVVALGQQAYRCVADAHDAPVPSGPYLRVVEDLAGIPLVGDCYSARLFGVYHCGARIRNTVRPMFRQVVDWERVGRALHDS